MKASLSIRTYTKRMSSHVHQDYSQLVFPIQGSIDMAMAGLKGKVSVGSCIVIRKGVEHGFQADEASRFVVADMPVLPAALQDTSICVFSVTAPLLSFVQFVEKQLASQVNEEIERAQEQLFTLLLDEQELSRSLDPRIRAVQAHIAERLDQPLTVAYLAEVAHLSPTQFKKLFKDNLNLSVHQYLTLERMAQAKALLTHTDLPVQLIAERVGYSDLSAFSRRFSKHFGMSPRAFSQA
ncbi:helix-turn-helix domain-containing protein [Marinomonas ostreistagni]|uniref:helix-turn-helix domain-containing protein n=1 Tax=Marinomonas ostreistagni TaxID=359209 RepID=UPI001951CD5C|nr:AraC family transcriptional regulator [Marinomonas ostreistagni]MBM6551823.1 helix-turn-helix domain-containing protein [Marinomonas ostreistagni]